MPPKPARVQVGCRFPRGSSACVPHELGAVAQVRCVSLEGLVRAVCSAWRSSLRGRRGSRGRCGKRVVRGGTRERRRGPASTFLFATCFRAVGNELQAAVQCECRAVGGAASPWLDAGRVHWRLKGGVQSRHTQRDARMGRACRTACMPLGRVGVRRRVGHVQLRGPCVWAWRGGVARRKARATRVPLRPSEPPRPPATSAGQPTVCVCATQPGALCGVCSSRGRGRERGCGREGSPHATRRGRRWATASSRVCVRPPGWRRGAPWSQRDARRSATASLRTGALPADEKSSNWSSRAERPGEEPEACVSTGARVPREARLPRGARAPGQKRRKRRPPEGHRQPRRRTGCTPETSSSHALQNDTPPPEPAPAGMLQGLPIAAERRAVGWGEMGRGAGEGVATSTAGLPRCAGARERRGAACADLLPDIFHLSRLMAAVPAANLVRWRALSSSGWGRALKRAATPSAGSRAAWSLVGGEERLVPTSSRILFHLSRLMVAVPAANLVRCG